MRNRRILRAALSTVIALTLTGGSAIAAHAAIPLGSVDNATEADARQGFNKYFRPLFEIQTNWTGNKKDCSPGEVNKQARTSAISAINYTRKLAGLAPTTESITATGRGQEAALMMHAADELSHYPSSDWPCYTEVGALGAASANLYWAWGANSEKSAADWIVGFLDDDGANNARVGHRTWILKPETSSFGVGLTSNTAALVVTGYGITSENPGAPNGVAWPSAGYFPADLVPTSNRWSFTQVGLQANNVQVTVTKNGSALGARPIEAIDPSYGKGTTIVWTMPRSAAPAIGAIDTYQISITGTYPPIPPYEVKVIPTTLPTPSAWIKTTAIVNGKTIDTARVGKEVAAKADYIDPITGKITAYPAGIKLSYKWYRDGNVIPGAYGATRKLTGSDASRHISVKVTASAPGYSEVSDTASNIWIAKGSFFSGNVAIAGTASGSNSGYDSALVGGTLTAKKYDFAPSPTSYAYQWYRGNTAIKGATKATYQPTAADKGKLLKVKVTASRAGFTSFTKASGVVKVK